MAGATKETTAPPTKAGQEGTTRAGTATRVHGRAAPPTTRGGTTRATRDGTHKPTTMAARPTAGDRDPTTLATTMDRAMVAAP